MSEDEVFVSIVCAIISLIAWIFWYWTIARVARLASSPADRSPLWVAPFLAAIILFAVLKLFASHDVRDDGKYLAFYMIMGAAWVGMTRKGLAILGLSARDDVVERKNPAAAYAIGGGVLGITLCFAGGNIGDGPGWWVVVFAAALSTSGFFFLWLGLDVFTRLADTVTIERDPAAGVRLAGFFIGTGLILGRAVAGNWISVDATVADFVALGWPALLLLVAAVLIERQPRPRLERDAGDIIISGGVPAAIYIGVGVVVLILQGRWS